MGVAEPEGCARWPGPDALASRNAADGVQHLWSLGLCADGMGLSGLGILALCALLGFMPSTAADHFSQAERPCQFCRASLISPDVNPAPASYSKASTVLHSFVRIS